MVTGYSIIDTGTLVPAMISEMEERCHLLAVFLYSIYPVLKKSECCKMGRKRKLVKQLTCEIYPENLTSLLSFCKRSLKRVYRSRHAVGWLDDWLVCVRQTNSTVFDR